MAGRKHLVRRHLNLSFLLLLLPSMFTLIAVFLLHVELHGAHTGHHETVSMAGEAHLVMLSDVIVQRLTVGGPEGT